MQVGSKIVLGGTFTNVSPAGVNDGTQAVSRTYTLAFNPTTGALDTGYAPVLDGIVWDVWPGPVANTVYLAGAFTTINGVKSKGIALVSTTTGALVAGWKPVALNGVVYSVRQAGSHLLIGGAFTTVGGVAHAGIASLNPDSTAVRQADSSNTRRAHMDGDVVTELTLRNTL